MQEELISKATKRNWKRLQLNKEALNKKLTSRANKKLSKKKIIPSEYFDNPENKKFLKEISAEYNIKSVLYTLAINLLAVEKLVKIIDNKIFTSNKYVEKILEDYKSELIPELLDVKLPKNERDILGIIYQANLPEGSKSKTGSYYTPRKIPDEIVEKITPDDKFLDPCCGTGSFLLAASEVIKNPQNIYGCDIDENACFIAKINLILKFKNKIFNPKIYNRDFLLSGNSFGRFSIIATNPPWGAAGDKMWKKKFPAVKSGESFSYFIMNSAKYLKPDGRMFFVLPESVLNVKVHNDIRKFILENFHIEQINIHGRAFKSVLSKVITLHLTKDFSNKNVVIKTPSKNFELPQDFYNTNYNNNFSILDNKDIKLLGKIYSIPHRTLTEDSIWAIGIVTGNNSKYIHKNAKNGEKIYSGKNIKKGEITDTNDYIIYDRDKFQQTAADEIYRAKEKLVYKFISKKLIFACDDKQRLFLNSANILIPKLDGYDIKTVMKFLNSALFQYIYTKKFNELKILKGNLMELPFPVLKDKTEITDDRIYEIFKLTEEEITRVESIFN